MQQRLAMIDWSATGSMLSGIGTLFSSLAVIYAARKGVNTFSQWRRQKSEERRISAAEDILTLCYKLKRAFEHIRSPGLLSPEIERTRQILRESGGLTDETDEELFAMRVTAQATISRTLDHQAKFEALLDIMPIAKAIFGEDIESNLNVFWRQRGLVVVAANGYAQSYFERHEWELGDDERAAQAQARWDRYETTIWEGGGADGRDAVKEAIDGAVAKLEQKLLPIIRNEPASWEREHRHGAL